MLNKIIAETCLNHPVFMKNNVVIYHKSDFDGIFCREIARKAYGDKAEYIGWEYGEPEPIVRPEQYLFILDLSVPGLMKHPGLIWIDHHKSTIEQYKDFPIAGLQIDGVAACRLAWQYFFGETVRPFTKQDFIDRKVIEPLSVRLAGEFDIWDKRDPRAEQFQLGLKAENYNDEPDLWKALFFGDHTVKRIIEAGQIIQVYQRNIDSEILKSRAFDLHWNGLTFLAINHARCNSMTFESGAKSYHDGLLSFCWNGTKWTISMYHTTYNKEIDLSKIAVQFGGGGHKGACGFTCKILPFDIDQRKQ